MGGRGKGDRRERSTAPAPIRGRDRFPLCLQLVFLAEVTFHQLSLCQGDLPVLGPERPVGRHLLEDRALAGLAVAGAACVQVPLGKVFMPAHESLIAHRVHAVRAAQRNRQAPRSVTTPAAAEGPATEREKLIRALSEAGGSRSRAAEILGVSRVTVWKRIKRYGLVSEGKGNK